MAPSHCALRGVPRARAVDRLVRGGVVVACMERVRSDEPVLRLAFLIVDEARCHARLDLDARERSPQAGSELQARVQSRTPTAGRKAEPRPRPLGPTIDQRRVADTARVGSALSRDREPET